MIRDSACSPAPSGIRQTLLAAVFFLLFVASAAPGAETPLETEAPHRPTRIGSQALAWDANGNLTQKGEWSYVFDYRNRLTRVLRAGAEVASEPLAQAISAGALRLQNVTKGEAVAIAVDRPVLTGREARRRWVITGTDPPETTAWPLPGESVELVVEPAALADFFDNRPAVAYQQAFTWPAGELVVTDGVAPRLDQVCVTSGSVLELTFSEKLDAALAAGEIQLNGVAVAWQQSADGYTLRTAAPLAAGTYSLSLGTGALDLAGLGLASGVSQVFTVAEGSATQLVWSAPLPGQSESSTVGNELGFKGLPEDAESGLLYVRHRYYDPELGRFITADPMEYMDGPNRYQLALNDPVNFSDPTGLLVGAAELIPGSPAETAMLEAAYGAVDPSNPLWARGLLAAGSVAVVPLAAVEGILNFGYHVDVGTDRAAERFAAAAVLAEHPLDQASLYSQGVGSLSLVAFEALSFGLPAANVAASPVARGLGRIAGATERLASKANPFGLSRTIGSTVDEAIVAGAGDLEDLVPRFSGAVPRAVPGPLPSAIRMPLGNEKFGLEHILRRHAFNSGGEGVSRFSRGMGHIEIRGLIHEANATSAAWEVQGNRRVLDVGLGRVIGTDRLGQATSGLRVVTMEAGDVITAYPIPWP